jgi:hypothetical protein
VLGDVVRAQRPKLLRLAHEFLRKIHNGVERLVSVLICLFEYGIGSDKKSRSSGFVG